MNERQRDDETVLREADNERDSLASWLAVELAPTILGSKPATILTFSDRTGFALLSLWRRYGEHVLRRAGIAWMQVREQEQQETVFFYHPRALRRCLFRACHKRFFARCGYCGELDAVLAELRRRFAQGRCPHEIGLLLGIPLKDVAGFLEARNAPPQPPAPWKIYGPLEPSLRLIRSFHADTHLVRTLLAKHPPATVLGLAASGQLVFRRRPSRPLAKTQAEARPFPVGVRRIS